MISNRRAFIGLGGNEGDRPTILRHAMRSLDRLSPGLRCSPVFESHPLGRQRQPNFLNAVVEMWWKGSAYSLLTALQAIERRLGRRRMVRWSSRPVDLDLLLLDGHICCDGSLTIPHPSIARRPFVLRPLLSLDSRVRSPVTGRRYARYLCLVPSRGMRRLDTSGWTS
ncbi:2-amino-4-hydroxy-6-hydroxymethyldihydropteridine diphosphokinase [Candidatus Fermentibacteria bacterium]|nr:2-amino-4-hydroxy-6-hydroxymethyldihydropteridine diphosphokinase [Candidatus Fermentibacteria bacterium]